MTSRLNSLMTTLKTAWTLASPLATANMTFRIGEPEDLNMRFTPRSISVEFTRGPRYASKRTKARAWNAEWIYIQVWMQMPPTKEHVLTWEERMENIVDHIESLVQSNQETFTGYRFVSVQDIRPIDNVDEDVLRSMVTLVGRREIS